MLAIDAMDLMKFETVPSYSVGKMDVEYMSPVVDEVATLEAFGLFISLNVIGECSFKYDGEVFREEDELSGRVDIINAMRKDEVKYDETPWFEVMYNDKDGELIGSEIMNSVRLPTKLEMHASLIRELGALIEGLDSDATEEQLEILEMLPGYQSITIKLDSGVRLRSMQEKMIDFLIKNEYLFQAIGTIEMETVIDDYEEMWFTLFCYCPNNDAMNAIRAEVITYGDTW